MMRRAVTLIELLTVIAILALLSGMAMTLFRREDTDVILAAARQLAATADRARQMAQRSGVPHLLTININNAGNGRVMRNFHHDDPPGFSGRHWYAIIGPDESNSRLSILEPPYATTIRYRDWYRYHFSTSLVTAVKHSQVGPTSYLPQGVRFLALTPWDGTRSPGNTSGRPWHGRYNEAEGRIYAWGGYDPEIGDRSGFEFHGRNEPAPVYDPAQRTMLFPHEVWGQIHKQATAERQSRYNATISTSRGTLYNAVKPDTRRTGPDTTVLPGTHKPLVDGHLLDWCLYFDVDGIAYWGGGTARDIFFKGTRSANAIRPQNLDSGGYHLFLTRDIDPEDRWGNGSLYDHSDPDPVTNEPRYERFVSADAAMRSMHPLRAVFIPRYGGGSLVLTRDHPSIPSWDFLE